MYLVTGPNFEKRIRIVRTLLACGLQAIPVPTNIEALHMIERMVIVGVIITDDEITVKEFKKELRLEGKDIIVITYDL